MKGKMHTIEGGLFQTTIVEKFRFFANSGGLFRLNRTVYKSCPSNLFVGLKFWTSWGPGCKNSKSPSRLDFFSIILKVDLKISRYLRGLFMKKI